MGLFDNDEYIVVKKKDDGFGILLIGFGIVMLIFVVLKTAMWTIQFLLVMPFRYVYYWTSNDFGIFILWLISLAITTIILRSNIIAFYALSTIAALSIPLVNWLFGFIGLDFIVYLSPFMYWAIIALPMIAMSPEDKAKILITIGILAFLSIATITYTAQRGYKETSEFYTFLYSGIGQVFHNNGNRADKPFMVKN